jgi:hypothetical protein
VDWRQLTRNKPLLVGIVGAGALGALVLLRRRGGPAGDTATAGAGAGGIGYPGTVDTTGTDVAAWLGNYSGALQSQLDEYGRSLQDALDGLRQIPTDPVPPTYSRPRLRTKRAPAPVPSTAPPVYTIPRK